MRIKYKIKFTWKKNFFFLNESSNCESKTPIYPKFKK